MLTGARYAWPLAAFKTEREPVQVRCPVIIVSVQPACVATLNIVLAFECSSRDNGEQDLKRRATPVVCFRDRIPWAVA